jgi:N6-adenosine-specific RNA methylase IME4
MSSVKLNTCIPERYSVLLIDPPWPQQKSGRRKVRLRQGRQLDYRTMPVDALFSLLDTEIFPLAAERHNLFVWTTENFLTKCEQELTVRGYRRHIRLIWNKGNGIAPCYTVRYAHEYLLWYYAGKFMPVAQPARGKLLSIFDEAPRQHSRKPEFAYHMIEQLYPGVSRFDVFSREQRTGWSQYGDQPLYFNQ